MEKASKALRRSGVRLKSMSSGYRELNMVISELRDVRSTAKAFVVAQNTAAQDMLKWSLNEENIAIRDTFVHLSELNALWTQAQKEFTDHLKQFITQFEMILEGEHHVDQARTHVAACEMRATKIKKELNKASKRRNEEETRELKIKLAQAKISCDQAQSEVADRIQENEAMKLIRIKEGLLKLSDSYLELAQKCCIIHEAHRDVAYQIPDVHNKELHEIRYTGSELANQAILRAKDQVRVYNRYAGRGGAPIHEGPPPPYSPINHIDSTPYNPYYLPPSFSSNTQSLSFSNENSNPFYMNPHTLQSHGTNDDGCIRESADLNSTNTNPFDDEGSNSGLLDSSTQTHLPTNHDAEEDLAGAVARLRT